jgi:hypothetical protein
MKDDFSWWKSISTLIFAIALLFSGLFYMFAVTPAEAVERAPDNSIAFYCKQEYNYQGIDKTSTKDMMNFAYCIDHLKNEMRRQEQAELWEFLKENPRYRFAGQSWNKCFGKPKERALIKLETKNDGSTTAYYKDKVVECYQ